MKYLSFASLIVFLFTTLTPSKAQNAATAAPLRVAIAGLVHGHVDGFFQHSLRRSDIQIVGIAEADQQVVAHYAAQYGLAQSLMFTDLEDMLQKTHPQAVLAYTNTHDHRKVVEICARHGVPVMMEKPLAVSAEDAHAIADAARKAKIQVLVNYETSYYRSNYAAYDLVHDKSIGDIRKVVVHDGHQGPKEINVRPRVFCVAHRSQTGRRWSALRLWLLRRRSDDLAHGWAAADFRYGCHSADQA